MKSSPVGSLSASFGFGLLPVATFPCVVELLSFGESFAESMKQKRMPAKVGSDATSKKFSVRVGEYATDADAQKEIEYVRSVCKCKATVEKR